MLWDLKLRPAKEKAVASELDEVFDGVVCPGVLVDRLVLEEIADGCLRCTDSCKLFANAFSCWRMN